MPLITNTSLNLHRNLGYIAGGHTNGLRHAVDRNFYLDIKQIHIMSGGFTLLGGLGLIAICLVILIAWLWLSWVCVAILVAHFGIPGGILMQVFLWLLVSGLMGSGINKK